jgi:hypothetical protein
MVPKVCFMEPRESVTRSQEICGYISVVATLEFTYFLN